jgi:bifunctional non-homologous end joining protein LigD
METGAITHPEKVLFPADGITKADLAEYHEAVAPLMVPYLRGRPITMERYPAGIDKPGFIQKDVSKGFPAWLERVEVPKKGGTSFYPLVNDGRSLLWTVNQNSITPHVWTSRLPHLERPDLCVFDLDPARDEPEPLRRAALDVRALLEELGLASWVKTSGSKGFHIVVPLDAETEFDAVWEFTHGCGAVLVKRHPTELTQEFIKADRGGRILVDTGRNGYGATFAAVYAVRPKAGAPVSAPCTWSEIEKGVVGPRTFTLRSMAERIASVGDLWADMQAHPQSLGDARERLRALLTDADRAEARAASRRRPGSRKATRGEKR